MEQELREIDVDVWVLKRHRMRQWHRAMQAVIQIRNLIRNQGIALIHSNGFRAHLYGGLAARWAGIPEVWTNHAVEQENVLTRLICSVPTHQIIANCTRTGDFFRNRGLPAQTIWPGVHLGRLEQGTAREPLASRYQLPTGARWISMGARLQRFKGHSYFLRALASLPADSQTHGVVIGGSLFGLEQEYLAELKREATTLGLDGRVTFTGFIPDDDVAGLLKASELVIHPALDEDFGLTVAEAQALGVPVLAFAAVGPAAILEHDRTGWLVPIGDQTALNTALNRALADPQHLRVLGTAGRQRVRERFTIEVHTRQTEVVYERVLQARGNPQRLGNKETGGPTNLRINTNEDGLFGFLENRELRSRVGSSGWTQPRFRPTKTRSSHSTSGPLMIKDSNPQPDSGLCSTRVPEHSTHPIINTPSPSVFIRVHS